MLSDFKKFLLKSGIFILLLVITDQLVGAGIRIFYNRQVSGFEYRTKYAIEKANEEVIIFGSSRAAHHYNSAVIGKKLNKSAYNAGRDGNFILYSYGVFTSMVKRYKPRLVIFDVSPREFELTSVSYDRLSVLMPFYKSNPELRDLLNLRSKYEPYKNFSSCYPFNSLLQTIVLNNVSFGKDKEEEINGYLPFHKTIDRQADKLDLNAKYEFDEQKIKAFNSMLEYCLKNDIPIFVTCSPYYDSISGQDPSLKAIARITAEKQVPFWDFSRDPRFAGKRDLFYDFNHLNDAGAELYSELVSDSITGELSAH